MGDLVETRQADLKRKKICRFCLSQDETDLSNIYSRENRMKTAPLPLQVMACVSIEVFSNDSMPSYVCNDCRLMFDYCYRFKQMCKKADTCLRHYPLTGEWSAALDKPKIPVEILKKQYTEALPKNNPKNGSLVPKVEETKPTTPVPIKKPEPRNLNALQISRVKPDPGLVEKIEIDDESGDTILTMVTDSQQEIQIQDLVRPDPESEPEQEVQPQVLKPRLKRGPDPKPISDKPIHKLLNKAAIRILNKEAQHTIEPRMTKPVMKRDDDGNIAIITQILDPNDMVAESPDPVTNAAVIETNVFPCPHCERSFPLRQLLEIHMVNHNRERSFNCSDCDKSFFSKYDLQKHILVHTGEKPFKCVVCGKGFTRSTLLHRHEKTHTDIPKFICVFCEKPFISQEEMEKHTERHRKNRPFSCKICQKSFAFKQGLERHEVVHCRFQPYQCQYCDQSFSTPSKLSRHLTAHAGARPYPCKLCPKAYLLSHHLTRHMRSHKDGAGSYKCNDCDKTFSTRDDLIYHSAVHATQTLVCPLCKDAFEDIETVTEHVKQHAEGEAFACEFCDLIFMTANRLQEHTDADHADEMVAYNEDEQQTAAAAEAEKKNEAKSTKSNDSANREIDEVIEEFLIEEFSDVGPDGNANAASSVVVKEETEWQTQSTEPQQTGSNEYEQDGGDNSNGEESIDYMNIIEESDTIDEPPAKVTKVTESAQQVTKKPTPTALFRHKLPTKPPQTPTQSNSNSSSPKENKEPLQKPKPAVRGKPEIRSAPVTPVPKTRQPTIQAALQGLPRSVSVKKVTTATPQTQKLESKPTPPSKPVATLLNKTSLIVKKTSPKVVATPAPESDTKQSPQSNPRMLRQRSDISPNTKSSANASPSAQSSEEIKKSPAAVVKKIPALGSVVGDKKIVEMMIGDKRVKVQRITMSKAQAAAMAREGRIEMKQGTMILKKSKT